MTAELLMAVDLPEFMFNPERKDGLAFDAGDMGLTIKIKPKRPDDDGFGHRLGISAKITRPFDANADQVKCIAGLIENKIAKDIVWPFDLPLESRGELIVDQGGNIQDGMTFWFEWLPTDLRDLVDTISDHMWNEFYRFIQLVCWEQDQALPPPTRSPLSLYWRIHSDTLYYLLPPRGHSQSARASGGFSWDEANQATTRTLWNQVGLAAPLAHELRNEAELAKNSAPRSALLLCASALEVGVKTHVARVAPATEWLILKLPSPPIGKILKDYLPLLHEAGDRNLEWSALKPLFKLCQEMMEARNSLAHGGVMPNPDALDRYHDATRDVLYILDYLDGHDWAREMVGPETGHALNWPKTQNHRRFVSIHMTSGPER